MAGTWWPAPNQCVLVLLCPEELTPVHTLARTHAHTHLREKFFYVVIGLQDNFVHFIFLNFIDFY